MSAEAVEFGEPDLERSTIAVYGLGKMGLPLAAVLADAGATVLGVDIDEAVTAAVNAGESPVSGEPGLPELVSTYGGDELAATTDGVAAASEADVMVVLVPTVLDEDERPSLGPVVDVAGTISAGLGPGDLVLLESTVPPGTTAGPFREAVEPEGLEAGVDFGLAHCPERMSSGNAIENLTASYPKIVGGTSPASTAAAGALYRQFNEPGVLPMGSATAAEAVKVFEGAYRDVNIALANELAKACEEWGLDAGEIFPAANSQPYCNLLEPGIGVGGHCIPVYPHFVIDRAAETELLETARAVNDGMPAHALDILESLLSGHGVDLADAGVLVLGLTYRPGVEEIRYAPAVALVESLRERGTSVYAHDPLLEDGAVESLDAVPVGDPESVEDLDAVVLATGHEAYASVDLGTVAERLRTPVFLDGRAFFDRPVPEGLDYVRIGDGTPPHPRSG